MLEIQHVTSLVSPGSGERMIFAVSKHNLVYWWDMKHCKWQPYSDLLEAYDKEAA